MKADTLDLYRRYTGEETYARIVRYPTLTDMWEARAKEYANLTAIADSGSEYTYAQLAQDVAAFRGVLRDTGVQPGSRVALLLPNSYDFVKAFLAVVTFGCTAAILPVHLNEQQVRGVAKRFGCAALVAAGAAEADVPVIPVSQTADAAAPAAACQGSDGCTIIMTGGTTGVPKGALLSHTAVMQGVINSCLGVKGAFEQRYMLVLPLSHVFGLIRNLLA